LLTNAAHVRCPRNGSLRTAQRPIFLLFSSAPTHRLSFFIVFTRHGRTLWLRVAGVSPLLLQPPLLLELLLSLLLLYSLEPPFSQHSLLSASDPFFLQPLFLFFSCCSLFPFLSLFNIPRSHSELAAPRERTQLDE